MLVLASPGPTGERDGNPYVRLLYTALATTNEPVEVRAFTRAGLLQRPDVVHIHWPEFLVRWDLLRHAVPDLVKVLALLAFARARGTSVVWTAHNLQPHDVHRPWLWRWFFRLFLMQVDLVILLTASSSEAVIEQSPALRKTAMRVVPHGHYRDEYGSVPSVADARERLGLADLPTLLAFGQIKEYKRTVELCQAFAERPAERGAQLLVAGNPGSEALRDSLTSIDSPGIRLFLQQITHDEVPTYFAACDFVVLPYSPTSALNSGVALLALSLGRPVVMLDGSVGRELREIVGPEWVTLTGPDVVEIVETALSQAPISTDDAPDLSSLDWERIGRLTLTAYQSSQRLRTGPA